MVITYQTYLPEEFAVNMLLKSFVAYKVPVVTANSGMIPYKKVPGGIHWYNKTV